MSKDQANEEQPKKIEKPQATIKVVAIEVDKEFTEPKGWILKEVHSLDVEAGKFFGVLVKVIDYPEEKPKIRVGKPVNLKD